MKKMIFIGLLLLLIFLFWGLAQEKAQPGPEIKAIRLAEIGLPGFILEHAGTNGITFKPRLSDSTSLYKYGIDWTDWFEHWIKKENDKVVAKFHITYTVMESSVLAKETLKNGRVGISRLGNIL